MVPALTILLLAFHKVTPAIYKGEVNLGIGKHFIDGEEAEPSYLLVRLKNSDKHKIILKFFQTSQFIQCSELCTASTSCLHFSGNASGCYFFKTVNQLVKVDYAASFLKLGNGKQGKYISM